MIMILMFCPDNKYFESTGFRSSTVCIQSTHSNFLFFIKKFLCEKYNVKGASDSYDMRPQEKTEQSVSVKSFPINLIVPIASG